jgi:hypothetical protein
VRTTRRLGALAVSTVIAGTFITGPAHAAGRPETFLGSATSTALNLDLLGTKLTLGFAKSSVDSTVKALAEAAGQLLQPASSTRAESSASAPRSSDGEKCAIPSLLEPLKALLNIQAGCSTALTEILNGVPQAIGKGTVARIDLGLNSVLQTLNQVIAPVQSALENVLGSLGQIAPQLDPLVDTVGELLTSVLNQQTLSIRLGDATSNVTSTANAITSTATAAGGQIDLLPIGGLDAGPLVSIIVGSAKASATYDRSTGVATPVVDPALVRVRLALPLLGQVQEIPVAIGQTITLLQGTPLESTIAIADGTTTTNADGSVLAVSDGVLLHLLKGLNGGVKLELAHAEAGVAGAPAVAAPAPEVPQVVPELPRTGGFPAALPFVGTGMLAAAFVGRRYLLSRVK